MAQFGVKGLDELVEAFERMGRIDEIAPKMLEEAVPILKEEVVRLAETHKVTGDMASSIKETKPRERRGGHEIRVRPTGKDRNGIRNMEKAAWIEFGTKGRSGTPFITSAVLNAEADVKAKMQEVFNREVSG